MAAATKTWLPSNLLFDRHLICTIREEQSWKYQIMKDKQIQRVLEKRNAASQRLLYSYFELRTGGLPPYPPVLSGTAIKCLLSHSDVEDIYLEAGVKGSLSDFTSSICAAPPDEFIALLESLASASFDNASPRARRVTLRAMEVLTYRNFSWSRKHPLTFYPDSLFEPFSSLILLKKDVNQYARYHKYFSSIFNPDSAKYRSFTTDIFIYALSIGFNPTEALACTDEVVDHYQVVQFLSSLPKRVRKTRSTTKKDTASSDTRKSRGRKRTGENSSLLQEAPTKKMKLDSPAQLNIAVDPQPVALGQQQRIKPSMASQIQVSAGIQAATDETSHKSYSTKERKAQDASMEEKMRQKAEKRRRKEERKLRKMEKRLRKEEKRRHRQERLQRKEERRRLKEEKRQQMLAQPSPQKTAQLTTDNPTKLSNSPHKEQKRRRTEETGKRMLAPTSIPNTTRRTAATPQRSNNSPRKDSHQPSAVQETPRPSTGSTSISLNPELFDGPSQQLWTDVRGQLLQVTSQSSSHKSSANKKDSSQAVKAEIGSSKLNSASDNDHLGLKQPSLDYTARKKRKLRETTSHYFSPPSSPKHKIIGISAIPAPLLNTNYFGLIQEELADKPFALLVAVKLLNKTRGHFADRSHPLSARNTFTRLIDCYPTPESLANAKVEDVTTSIRHLGLQNQRAKTLIAMAQVWVRAPPQKGIRYPTPGYPKHIQGSGKQMIGANSKITNIDDESVDPRIDAFEIAHLPGVGPYALDSWRIFCRDVLRGLAPSYNGEGHIGRQFRSDDGEFEPEWKRVRPADKELRAFLKWMWLREGWIWDPETGERYIAT